MIKYVGSRVTLSEGSSTTYCMLEFELQFVQIKMGFIGNSLVVQWLGQVLSLLGPGFNPWTVN